MRLRNATIATLDNTDSGNQPDGDSNQQRYGLINNGSVVIEDELIAWVGSEADVPSRYRQLDTTDLDGRLLTPAFVDCHTHIVHGGHRANEFEMRLEGASYTELARAGGGIVSTMHATRKSSIDQLVSSALPRVDALLAEGVSLIEIKSGYGLDHDTELAMLKAARKIAALRPVRVTTSFLGAHSVPPEYTDRGDAYIDEICLPGLQAAHRASLVDAVDGFCESIAFNPAQIERLFTLAKELGLPVKLHAEQLSHSGGAALAARFAALSADHLEYANEQDAQSMAEAGTVAVLLPGAFYTLRETRLPPIAAFRHYGVAMALATDCNPGSSPVSSPLLVMNMACTLFRLTPAEALAGVTRNAAKALGRSDTGMIKAGLRADMAAWNVGHPAELAYRIGSNMLHHRWFAGA